MSKFEITKKQLYDLAIKLCKDNWYCKNCGYYSDGVCLHAKEKSDYCLKEINTLLE